MALRLVGVLSMQYVTETNGEVSLRLLILQRLMEKYGSKNTKSHYVFVDGLHQQSVTDGKVSTKERKLLCVCRSRKALRSLSGSSLIFLFNASIFSFHFRVKYLLIFCPPCLVKHFHKKALKTDFLFSEKKNGASKYLLKVTVFMKGLQK